MSNKNNTRTIVSRLKHVDKNFAEEFGNNREIPLVDIVRYLIEKHELYPFIKYDLNDNAFKQFSVVYCLNNNEAVYENFSLGSYTEMLRCSVNKSIDIIQQRNENSVISCQLNITATPKIGEYPGTLTDNKIGFYDWCNDYTLTIPHTQLENVGVKVIVRESGITWEEF